MMTCFTGGGGRGGGQNGGRGANHSQSGYSKVAVWSDRTIDAGISMSC